MHPDLRIRGLDPVDVPAVLDLSLRAWGPVFATPPEAGLGFVHDAFYPDGFATRQMQDVRTRLADAADRSWVAEIASGIAGFLSVDVHPEDRMGEIAMLAVDPAWQRQGLAASLMAFAEARLGEAGMAMVMVETGGDAGHAPARAAYEAGGYRRWPVARYFKPLG